MLLLGKEEYMAELGTSAEEQKDLKELTFETFINLKVGDTVFWVNDWTYFIKAPFIVDYSKWLKSPDGVYTRDFKSFYYKQVSFVRDTQKRYADSASHNYRDLYVTSKFFKELLERQKQRKKSGRR